MRSRSEKMTPGQFAANLGLGERVPTANNIPEIAAKRAEAEMAFTANEASAWWMGAKNLVLNKRSKVIEWMSELLTAARQKPTNSPGLHAF
jgi:hypothetical protein